MLYFRLARAQMVLFAVLAFTAGTQAHAQKYPHPFDDCTALLRQAPRSFSEFIPSTDLRELEADLARLSKGGPTEGPGIKVIMAAIELGKVPGLKTVGGQQVNISAGGVAAVLNDIGEYYPRLLSAQKGGSLAFVGVLMDGISTEQMTHIRNIQVKVDGKSWDVGVHSYRAPNGATYYFLDNPSFRRFTVTPDPKVQGQSIYTMRGLEAGSQEDLLEEQRIWSAFNQSVARVFADEKGQIFVPHDSHVAPASFYVYKRTGRSPISAKPLVHNEGYLGSYFAGGELWERVQKIWALDSDEMKNYFTQHDQLVMMAPAVRIAEQHEIYSALSVSSGTARAINENHSGTAIDFFHRVGDLTNGLGEENRPHLNSLLKPGTRDQVLADGIQDPDVVRRFTTEGYAFGDPDRPSEEILEGKARAKAALQKNLGMSVDGRRPLFVAFARMVHQKGMGFIAPQVEHILAQGGQVVVGGPVGDAVGAAERTRFLDLKEKLIRDGNPNANNFVYIDGPVKGRLKGLVLAGGDFFLIPSRYEPCGLTDCEALYNGTIPIAHRTGGLNKGKATILYRPVSADDQGWQLGEAINEGFRKFADRETFEKSQIAAMKENFSVEKNFDLFLRNNRIELYGKIFRKLDRLIIEGKANTAQVHVLVRQLVMIQRMEDVPELLEAFRMLHPTRRSPLMKWFIQKYEKGRPS